MSSNVKPGSVVSDEQRATLNLAPADVQRLDDFAAISPRHREVAEGCLTAMQAAGVESTWNVVDAQRGRSYCVAAFIHAVIHGKRGGALQSAKDLKSDRLREIAESIPASASSGRSDRSEDFDF